MLLVAPEISASYREVSQPIGSETMITCLVTANPITRVYWMRNDAVVTDNAKRQSFVWNVTRYTRTLCLSMRNLSDVDYGAYKCVVENQFDRAVETVTIHSTSQYIVHITGLYAIQLVVHINK